MRIAGDGGYAFDTEVESRAIETRTGKERGEEGAEAAIDMEWDARGEGEAGKGGDVVNYAMGEVWRRGDEEDRVVVYETGDGTDVNLERRRVDCNLVELDVEVGGCFVEGGVGSDGDDPKDWVREDMG